MKLLASVTTALRYLSRYTVSGQTSTRESIRPYIQGSPGWYVSLSLHTPIHAPNHLGVNLRIRGRIQMVGTSPHVSGGSRCWLISDMDTTAVRSQGAQASMWNYLQTRSAHGDRTH